MPKMATTTYTLNVEYDADKTDPEGLATALDTLMETALSTPGILDEYGAVNVGVFFVQEDLHGNKERACSKDS